MQPTWNEIFAAVAPVLINEGSDIELRNAFRVYFTQRARDGFVKSKDLKGKLLEDFKFRSDDIETCIIQFRALNYIKENIKQRSIKDTNTYWSLTPYGDYLMTQLRAIRKDNQPTEEEIKKVEEAE